MDMYDQDIVLSSCTQTAGNSGKCSARQQVVMMLPDWSDCLFHLRPVHVCPGSDRLLLQSEAPESDDNTLTHTPAQAHTHSAGRQCEQEVRLSVSGSFFEGHQRSVTLFSTRAATCCRRYPSCIF